MSENNKEEDKKKKGFFERFSRVRQSAKKKPRESIFSEDKIKKFRLIRKK